MSSRYRSLGGDRGYGERIRALAARTARAVRSDPGSVAALLVLAAALLAGLVRYARTVAYGLTTPYAFEYGEGFMLYFATHLGAMYEPIGTEPFLPTVYPPLYHLLVGGLHWLVGDRVGLFALGRSVSVAAAVATALLVAALVRASTADAGNAGTVDGRWSAVAGAVAAGVFLSTPLTLQWGVAARVTILGLCLSVAAIYWYLAARDGSRRQVAGCAALCLLALYAKQSFVAAPLSIALALFLAGHRRRAAEFVLSLGAAGLLVLAALAAATDGQAWYHLVVYNSSQSVELARIAEFAARFVVAYPILLALGGAVVLHRRSLVPTVVLVYLVAAGAVAVATVGKPGSNDYYFFETVTALCVVAGCALAAALSPDRRLFGTGATPAARTFVVLILVAQVGLFLPGTPVDEPTGAAATAATIEGADGPVLTEDNSLLVSLDRTPTHEPFLTTQLAAAGTWDQTPVVRSIEEGQYSYVVLLFDVEGDPTYHADRWTDAQLEAIAENYELAERNGDYRVYVPASETERPDGESS